MTSNKFNLPAPLVAALTPRRSTFVEGRLSVTALIDAPIRRILMKQHVHEIEEDVSENLWALLGKMGHKVLELDSDSSEIKIEQPFEGATIVGVVDYMKGGRVVDFKFVSVWAVIFKADNKTNELQLQLYAYLVQLNGKPVNEIANYLILRDWNKREMQKNPDYPRIPFAKISYPLWPRAKIEAYISERVSLHLRAEKFFLGGSQEEIPAEFMCSPKERWAKSDTWAVLKKGRKKAMRVLAKEKDAMEYRKGIYKAGEYTIEFRPGENVRCENYCSVSRWCEFYKEYCKEIGRNYNGG